MLHPQQTHTTSTSTSTTTITTTTAAAVAARLLRHCTTQLLALISPQKTWASLSQAANKWVSHWLKRCCSCFTMNRQFSPHVTPTTNVCCSLLGAAILPLPHCSHCLWCLCVLSSISQISITNRIIMTTHTHTQTNDQSAQQEAKLSFRLNVGGSAIVWALVWLH